MLLIQHSLGCLAHVCFPVVDEVSGHAAIVDPPRNVDQYLQDASQLGFGIRSPFLTHNHADILDGHNDLRVAFLRRDRCPLGAAGEEPWLASDACHDRATFFTFKRSVMMAQTLEQFSAECHRILKAEPGPEGRQKVCTLLQDVLKDEAFIARYLADDAPERKILYEDSELGFCILGHVYHGAKESPPHDHGPTWAIYGQAAGETEMTDWEVVEAATEDKPGRVKAIKTYTLTPGAAYVYNEGDLHSPRRESTTKLIRFEGVNVETIKRLPYKAV